MNGKEQKTDCIIIGAGIFGLYAALLLVKRGQSVTIIDKSLRPFSRASAINQARVHNGYHYPRSCDTAEKVADYYNKFIKDFDFAINNSFQQIYAIASNGSKTSAQGFINFCKKVNIPLKEVNPSQYFNKGSVEAAFLTEECGFDFAKIRDYLLYKINASAACYYGVNIKEVKRGNPTYTITLDTGLNLSAPLIINASYAGINEVIDKFDQDFFDLKYELCEMVLCEVSREFKNLGITVMDGDFFSIMPFGSSNFHVLTSVGHTPHYVSCNRFPTFKNHTDQSVCKTHGVRECIVCSQNLKSAWNKMHSLSRSFLRQDFKIKYKDSKFELKALLKSSESNDSRPTIIKHHMNNPAFISVLSGKISTIYDLEKICEQPDRLEILSSSENTAKVVK
jgi:hypothetical protein